ncbi:hypothetical protein GOODEAATRI_002272 [Goodea atripinnis]|uniref:Uncharacterized protein n=1 Tax=Goodea atripinnis TaxID=208336 RepID=A0ABV0PKB9_9TELE
MGCEYVSKSLHHHESVQINEFTSSKLRKFYQDFLFFVSFEEKCAHVFSPLKLPRQLLFFFTLRQEVMANFAGHFTCCSSRNPQNPCSLVTCLLLACPTSVCTQ